ncbi:ATP-grasp fold amidoligase family protein [Rhizobium halophytocola]|uniref:Polysaccharide biosynthesis protein n=1 Tax=Rhizobium halophytocola TaxID=735519 RepID=A0ABS4DSI4_9HYPH|nr:ATP-grasp fold amidoligase family protein [Rhizobium halophytocola]MBP1848649.1 hypothetical protein [Rhizobium halophytocola]
MTDISLSAHQKGSLTQKMRHLFWRAISSLPDAPYIRWKYFSLSGRFPDLAKPRLFTEKVQVRKLYDRNPIYPGLVDKAAAKAVIAERAGPQYVIETYWVGTDIKTIDWSTISLPAVAKPTNGSGQGCFLRTTTDVARFIAEDPTPHWLAIKHHRINREWAYGAVAPQVIIERMLVEGDGAPDDYRVFIFSGVVSHIEVRLRRDGIGYECNYTPDWEKMAYCADYYPLYPQAVERPAQLDEMLDVARRLAADLDFMRVDFYVTPGRLHVGEMTLYPGGGFHGCVADEYDAVLGERWQQQLYAKSG